MSHSTGDASTPPPDGPVRQLPRTHVRASSATGRQFRGFAVLRIGDDEVLDFGAMVPDKPRSEQGPVARVPLHELDGFVSVDLWGRFAGRDVVVMSIDDRTVSFYANAPPRGVRSTVCRARSTRDTGEPFDATTSRSSGKRSSTCSPRRCGGRASTCEATSGAPPATAASGHHRGGDRGERLRPRRRAGRAGAGPAQPWGRRAARTLEPRSRKRPVSLRRSLPAHVPTSAARGVADPDAGDDHR